jgi:hypothetical protein
MSADHHSASHPARLRLSLLAFPHAWDGRRLRGSVLLLPTGDPLHAPLFPWSAPFASLPLTLRLVLTPGDLTRPQTPVSSDFSGVLTVLIQRPVSTETKLLFEALHAQFLPTPQPSNAQALAQQQQQRRARMQTLGLVVKALPPSYQKAKLAAKHEAIAPTTSGLKQGEQAADAGASPSQPRAQNENPTACRHVSWGQVLAHALRQPALARALGLVVDFEVDLAGLGMAALQPAWLHAALVCPTEHLPANETSNPSTPTEGVVSYAARLPPLDTRARTLFAAVLFPVSVRANAPLNAPLIDPLIEPQTHALLNEAAAYNDGFARIVHADQSADTDADVNQDAQAASVAAPCADVGIALAWDDEQLLRWANRQLEPSRLPNTSVEGIAVHAPVAVAGYRVDARLHRRQDRPDSAKAGWHSLCGARADLTVDAWRTQFNGELRVDVAPHAAIKGTAADWHLPRYFAAWRGGSLVLPDPIQQTLNGKPPEVASSTTSATTNTPNTTHHWAALPLPAHPALPALRYGQRWDFRVRLVDLSGGGPQLGHTGFNTVPSSVATLRFLRQAPPKALRITTADDTPTAALRQEDSLWIRRPLLAYPDFSFAGVDATPALVEQLARHRNAPRSVLHGLGVSDPDVTHVAVAVQVRAPAGDADFDGSAEAGLELRRDGPYIELFSVLIALPPRTGFAVDSPCFDDDEAALALHLIYTDCADVHTGAAALKAASTQSQLTLPTGRDVRLRCRAACVVRNGRRHHFADALIHTIDAQRVALGAVADLSRRCEEINAAGLLAAGQETRTTALWLQPSAWSPHAATASTATEPLHALAQAVGLCADGMRLRARPGHRVLLAATGRLGHVVEHGGSQIRFSSTHDMTGRWTVAHVVCLQRDWTWSGLLGPGIVIVPATSTRLEPQHPIGSVSLPFAVSSVATQARRQQRSHTTFILFDTTETDDVMSINDVDNVNNEALRQTHAWQARTSLHKQADIVSHPQALSLPFARRPRQVPRVLAMGVLPRPPAQGRAASGPSQTLWIEFERALSVRVADPARGLKYFARLRCVDDGLPEDHSPGCDADALSAGTTGWTAITALSFDRRADLAAAHGMTELVPAMLSASNAQQGPQQEMPQEMQQEMQQNVQPTDPSCQVSRWLFELPVGSKACSAATLQWAVLELCTGAGSAHWATPNARFSHTVRLPLRDLF